MKRIIYSQSSGVVAIFSPSQSVTDYVKIAKQIVPKGISYEIVNTADVPTDRIFRDAWETDTTTSKRKIKTNMIKAKLIAHDMRRVARNNVFKPLDIQATIPAQAKVAETKRQKIRVADAKKQIAIDAATTESELKVLVV